MARPRMSGQLCMTQVTPPPIWRPLKTSPPKVDKPTYGTKLYNIMQCFTPIGAMYLSSDKKIHIFLIEDCLEGYRAIHFWKALVDRANVTPHMTRYAATCRFRDIRDQKLGFWGPLWGTPKKWTLYPRPYRSQTQSGGTHHAEFHADRCHRRRNIYNRIDIKKDGKNTADLISDKSHFSVAFVDKIRKMC